MRVGPQAERFPQSALLFRFCLAVLQQRQDSTKTHDQDVGNILQFNASDTSHWKRGKKAVKSVYALEALSRALDVDFETLHDISDGTLDFEEAWFEFTETENLRRIEKALTPELRIELRQRALILSNLATDLLTRADIRSVPVHVPELATAFPFIEIVQRDVSDKLARSSRVRPGRYSIRFRKGETRGHTRIAVAREIARIVLHSERQMFNLPERNDALIVHEMFQLSNALLVPGTTLRDEYQKIPDRLNAVDLLSDVFWVPKSVIRARVSEMINGTLLATDVSTAGYSIRKQVFSDRSLNAADFSEEDVEDARPSGTVDESLQLQ